MLNARELGDNVKESILVIDFYVQDWIKKLKLSSPCFEDSGDLSSLVSIYVLLLTDRIIDFCKNCDRLCRCPLGNRDRLAIIENSDLFWKLLIESEYKLVGTRYMTQQELRQSYIRV